MTTNTKLTEMDVLLPCPFCGDTEEVGTRYDQKAWRVHCGACGGCAYGWETEGQAIATWNTRDNLALFKRISELEGALRKAPTPSRSHNP